LKLTQKFASLLSFSLPVRMMTVVPGGHSPEAMMMGRRAVLALTVTPFPPPEPASVIPVTFWNGTEVVMQYSPFVTPGPSRLTDETFFALEIVGDVAMPPI
jgi:hypothetical protein